MNINQTITLFVCEGGDLFSAGMALWSCGCLFFDLLLECATLCGGRGGGLVRAAPNGLVAGFLAFP